MFFWGFTGISLSVHPSMCPSVYPSVYKILVCQSAGGVLTLYRTNPTFNNPEKVGF